MAKKVKIYTHDLDVCIDGTDACIKLFKDLKKHQLDTRLEYDNDDRTGSFQIIGTREDLLDFILPWYSIAKSRALYDAMLVVGDIDEFDEEDWISECGYREVK